MQSEKKRKVGHGGATRISSSTSSKPSKGELIIEVVIDVSETSGYMGTRGRKLNLTTFNVEAKKRGRRNRVGDDEDEDWLPCNHNRRGKIPPIHRRRSIRLQPCLSPSGLKHNVAEVVEKSCSQAYRDESEEAEEEVVLPVKRHRDESEEGKSTFDLILEMFSREFLMAPIAPVPTSIQSEDDGDDSDESERSKGLSTTWDCSWPSSKFIGQPHPLYNKFMKGWIPYLVTAAPSDLKELTSSAVINLKVGYLSNFANFMKKEESKRQSKAKSSSPSSSPSPKINKLSSSQINKPAPTPITALIEREQLAQSPVHRSTPHNIYLSLVREEE